MGRRAGVDRESGRAGRTLIARSLCSVASNVKVINFEVKTTIPSGRHPEWSCPACQMRLFTMANFMDHLADDVLQDLIERLSTNQS
jgi:hypothetical protein